MGDEPKRDAANRAAGREDRFWVLLDSGERGEGPDGAEQPARRTLVVRDGDKILVSVPVGRGSALAAPLRIEKLPHVGARLIVRLASETRPCAPCVDERLAATCAEEGGLDAAGLLRAVREAIGRCAALAQADPDHDGGPEAALPESTRARAGAPLRLALPNAPHVDAGGALAGGSDVDVILII